MVYVDVYMYMYKTWMEGTCDIPYKYSYFFVTTEPKSNGVFTKMLIICLHFYNPKAYYLD